jgi:hypothetical protein
MTQTNNYYSYDSHNVTTTTTNNYSSTDSHNTTTTITTVDNSSVDSHDTTTNVSLIGGGILGGSLNNVLSGNTLLNLGDVLSGNTVGDVLSNDQILSPTLNVGDVNLGISDVVHDVLNPSFLNSLNVGDILSPDLTANVLNGVTTAIGDVLSPNIGDVLPGLNGSNILNVADVGNIAASVLPIAGDVLGNVNIADLSHLTATVGNVLPIATGLLEQVSDVGNVNIPVVSDILSGNVTNIAGDVLSHIANGDLSNLTANLPVVANVLNDVGNGNLDHITTNLGTTVGDVLSHIGSGDLSGITASLPANIAAPITGVIGDIANGAIGANATTVVGDVLSHIADAGLANGSIGDVVSHIASLGTGDLNVLNVSDIAHNVAANLVGNVSSIVSGQAGDLVHNLASVDLSDVGAVLHAQPIHDIVASNLDLDHLTNTLNLFDVGHLDVGHDIHHA